MELTQKEPKHAVLNSPPSSCQSRSKCHPEHRGGISLSQGEENRGKVPKKGGGGDQTKTGESVTVSRQRTSG